jgi:hypothetical protein
VQRQLNLYGFKCINRGEDKGAFFHPGFKRGEWDAVRKLTRFIAPKRQFSIDGKFVFESKIDSQTARNAESFKNNYVNVQQDFAANNCNNEDIAKPTQLGYLLPTTIASSSNEITAKLFKKGVNGSVQSKQKKVQRINKSSFFSNNYSYSSTNVNTKPSHDKNKSMHNSSAINHASVAASFPENFPIKHEPIYQPQEQQQLHQQFLNLKQEQQPLYQQQQPMSQTVVIDPYADLLEDLDFIVNDVDSVDFNISNDCDVFVDNQTNVRFASNNNNGYNNNKKNDNNNYYNGDNNGVYQKHVNGNNKNLKTTKIEDDTQSEQSTLLSSISSATHHTEPRSSNANKVVETRDASTNTESSGDDDLFLFLKDFQE